MLILFFLSTLTNHALLFFPEIFVAEAELNFYSGFDLYIYILSGGV